VVLALARATGRQTVVDVGSGRGELLRALRALDGSMDLIAVEIADRPDDLPKDISWLAELPEVVTDALAKRGPQGIPAYAIRVADDFHRFYHEHRVLESEQEAFRLGLCRATRTVIARCLDLVGVEAPDRM